MLSRDHSAADHWLSQFKVYLYTGLDKAAPVDDSSKWVPVEGSIIDVRIGAGGKVIGLWSSWRPYVGDPQTEIPLILPPLHDQNVPKSLTERPASISRRKPAPPIVTPPAPPSEPSAPKTQPPAHVSNSTPLPPLFYMLAGVAEPLRFIAPYSLIKDEHDAALWPASRYSLMVRIGQESIPGGARLHALVAGAEDPRQLRYFWGIWRPDLGYSDGLKKFENKDTMDINTIGVYNVILVVEDGSTGAIAQTQSMVYARTAEGQEPQV